MLSADTSFISGQIPERFLGEETHMTDSLGEYDRQLKVPLAELTASFHPDLSEVAARSVPHFSSATGNHWARGPQKPHPLGQTEWTVRSSCHAQCCAPAAGVILAS